jgi:glycosyltransferase involved in cell wall biosynthesis
MLVVAGEFWEDKGAYEQIVDQLGIGDSVTFEDRYIANEEVPVYFSAADVLVAPYRQATGSGAVQMALGCGCPVITTQVGELHEVVEDGTTGLITKPCDSQALAEDVIRYFEEVAGCPDRGRRRGDEGSSGWEKLVTIIEDVGKACELSSY